MGLYGRYVLPHLVDIACSAKPQRKQREKVVPRAVGRVLELGFGTGRNLPFYDPARVETVLALEPSRAMLDKAEAALSRASVPVELLEAPAENVPLEARSVDTVLVTFTLCSIEDTQAALQEAKRVLKPGGALLFAEHGKAPDPAVYAWQTRVAPVWTRVSGGCRLDRDVPGLLESAGFRLADLQASYIPGWRPASYNYWGRAEAAG